MGCATRPLIATAPATPTAPVASTAPAGDRSGETTVDADRYERLGGRVVAFSGKVVIRQRGSTQYADRVDLELDARGDSIVGAVSTGGVRIVMPSGDVASGEQADFDNARDRRIARGHARATWSAGDAADCESIVIDLRRDRLPALRCCYSTPTSPLWA